MHEPITNNGGQHVVLLPDISQVLLQGVHVQLPCIALLTLLLKGRSN